MKKVRTQKKPFSPKSMMGQMTLIYGPPNMMARIAAHKKRRKSDDEDELTLRRARLTSRRIKPACMKKEDETE
ncbi:MAG: hypothetical protein IJ080_08940 [Oscillospiraceae bacterium]|nr:hypothetical protein [Oscillospiraceae bacterium]MBQ8979860.1 hypothetical protein [Oscillospiraceae bacterium]